MHDDVDARQPARQDRVADVDDAPDRAGQVAAMIIDRYHPAEPVRLGQGPGDRQAKVMRGSRDGHNRLGAPPLANLGISVTHR